MNKTLINVFDNKRRLVVSTYLISFMLFCISIITTYALSYHYAYQAQITQLDALNKDMLARMQRTSKQFAQSVSLLEKDSKKQPCSQANIMRMQQIDISGTNIQAIGYFVNNQFQCSSQGSLLDGVQFGPPTIASTSGVKIWMNVSLPSAPQYKYILIEMHHYAAILRPIETIEFAGNQNASVAIIDTKSRNLYASKGVIKSAWINAYNGDSKQEFIDDDKEYMVLIEANSTGKSAVIAAAPIATIYNKPLMTNLLIMLISTLIGLGFAITFLYFMRRCYSSKTALIKALNNSELFLEYQPIIDLSTNQCIGAEALIRWRQGNGTMVPPDLFIPFAENVGLMRAITKYVLKLIEVDMASLLHKYPDFHIGINLSSSDLQSEETISLLRSLISTIGVDKGCFVIEATERGLLKDGVSQRLVNEIRQLGMKVAIDDFGTGYSSLSYLTRFELDYLKIDKAFVDSIDTENSHVAFHIIELAKSLNLTMIAEGVETEAQAKILQEHGVRYVQGWLFAKGMSPADLMRDIESRSMS